MRVNTEVEAKPLSEIKFARAACIKIEWQLHEILIHLWRVPKAHSNVYLRFMHSI